jgi:ABC-type glutathione transport system ATPase component
LALLHHPSILIADEPTSALDPVTQAEIVSLLRRLNRRSGTAMLYISHDLVSVVQLCNRLAVLHGGTIVECAPVARIEEACHPATLSLVGVINVCNRFVGEESVLVIVPIMYVFYRSYHLYLGRLTDQTQRTEIEERQVIAEKRHVEEVCALHLRTIEGLALAIDAKDHTTHEHLHRVRTYAIEIGKEVGLRNGGIGCPSSRRFAPRHWQAGRARSHHQQAGPSDSRRV